MKFTKRITKQRSEFMKTLNERKNLIRNCVSSQIFDEHSYSSRPSFTRASSSITTHHDHVDITDWDVQQNVTINTNSHEGSNIDWSDGRRIVELKLLAEQLQCEKCGHWLRILDTVGEKRCGLGSVLFIKCQDCGAIRDIYTGKRSETGAFDINTKVSLAMVNAGMGATHLNTFLSSCNLPTVDAKTLRKKERQFSQSLDKVAAHSCSVAREEEKTASVEKIEVSFDAGWQTRGTGWQYNSNTGHGSIIGKETGKVIDFDVRSKKCSICNNQNRKKSTSVPTHDCPKNWTGSSKAMECDMASSMLHNLEDQGFHVDVIHADNDSTTASRLKMEFKDLEKLDDRNHMKKGLSKRLYEFASRYKELKHPGTISYIVRSIMYGISSNSSSAEDIEKVMDTFLLHIFGDHSSCSSYSWCSYNKNPAKYSFKHLPDRKPLTNKMLQDDMKSIIDIYKARSSSLQKLGSTQRNESFNNTVASKAPKNRSYGGTCSLRNRVSAAVVQKNEGATWITKVNQEAMLSPGHFTSKYGTMRDKLASHRRFKQKQIETKRRRIQLKHHHQSKCVSSEIKEGETYGAEIGLSNNHEEIIPSPPQFSDAHNIVVFDLETTGLSRSSDIVQLAATNGQTMFSAYIHPDNQYQ